MSLPSMKARYSVRGPRSCWRDRFSGPGPFAWRIRSAMESSRVDAVALAPRRHFLDERGRVDDKGDPLVPQLARAGEPAHALQRRAERLDDHVLLAYQRAHDEAQPAGADHRDDDVLASARAPPFARLLLDGRGAVVQAVRQAEETGQAAELEARAAERDHLSPLDAPHAGAI